MVSTVFFMIVLEFEVFFGVVVADVLYDLTYQTEVFGYFAVFHVFAEKVAHDAAEIVVAWE